MNETVLQYLQIITTTVTGTKKYHFNQSDIVNEHTVCLFDGLLHCYYVPKHNLNPLI